MQRQGFSLWFSLIISLTLSACLSTPKVPEPGPDKQGMGLVSGAAMGAGAGAVTGAEVAAATGPGAWIGAGLGAIYGSISGLGVDLLEEDQIQREEETKLTREMAWVQEILNEHYARRLDLHPSRDIFPADLFFDGDGVELRPEGRLLAQELAAMSKHRMPWSRLVIASYVMSNDKESTYSQYITERRAKELADVFVAQGIEPRRLSTQAVTVAEPVVLDPDDSPDRYKQAIELIPLDY